MVTPCPNCGYARKFFWQSNFRIHKMKRTKNGRYIQKIKHDRICLSLNAALSLKYCNRVLAVRNGSSCSKTHSRRSDGWLRDRFRCRLWSASRHFLPSPYDCAAAPEDRRLARRPGTDCSNFDFVSRRSSARAQVLCHNRKGSGQGPGSTLFRSVLFCARPLYARTSITNA